MSKANEVLNLLSEGEMPWEKARNKVDPEKLKAKIKKWEAQRDKISKQKHTTPERLKEYDKVIASLKDKLSKL